MTIEELKRQLAPYHLYIIEKANHRGGVCTLAADVTNKHTVATIDLHQTGAVDTRFGNFESRNATSRQRILEIVTAYSLTPPEERGIDVGTVEP